MRSRRDRVSVKTGGGEFSVFLYFVNACSTRNQLVVVQLQRLNYIYVFQLIKSFFILLLYSEREYVMYMLYMYGSGEPI